MNLPRLTYGKVENLWTTIDFGRFGPGTPCAAASSAGLHLVWQAVPAQRLVMAERGPHHVSIEPPILAPRAVIALQSDTALRPPRESFAVTLQTKPS